MKNVLVGLVAIGMMTSSALNAADYAAPGGQCIPLRPAKILQIEGNVTLTDEVVRMMNEAVAVAEDPRWIAYTRPTFVWASEAKVACGKAFGYLRSNYRDEQQLNKCECFYERKRCAVHTVGA